MKRDVPHRSRVDRARPAERLGARWGVLLWLLPYLVLSLFAGAPHSHGVKEADGLEVAAAHFATARAAIAGDVQPAALPLEAGGSIECALCAWASSSLGTIGAPEYLHLARRGVVRGLPTCAVLLSASISGGRNRGPPLS